MWFHFSFYVVFELLSFILTSCLQESSPFRNECPGVTLSLAANSQFSLGAVCSVLCSRSLTPRVGQIDSLEASSSSWSPSEHSPLHVYHLYPFLFSMPARGTRVCLTRVYLVRANWLYFQLHSRISIWQYRHAWLYLSNTSMQQEVQRCCFSTSFSWGAYMYMK